MYYKNEQLLWWHNWTWNPRVIVPGFFVDAIMKLSNARWRLKGHKVTSHKLGTGKCFYEYAFCGLYLIFEVVNLHAPRRYIPLLLKYAYIGISLQN